MRGLRFLMWAFARCVLALRYRVRVRGLEKARAAGGPLLILPNHPAFIDPPILLTWLYPSLRPRPLLFEGNFSGPLAALIPLMDAIRVPDLDQTSAEARARTEQALEGLKDALRQGQNVLIWPSGMLQRTGVGRRGRCPTCSRPSPRRRSSSSARAACSAAGSATPTPASGRRSSGACSRAP